jgi:predicted DNA-binding ribbon-helix-helix protein
MPVMYRGYTLVPVKDEGKSLVNIFSRASFVMQTKALAGAETAMVEAKRMVDAVLKLSRPVSIREAADPITPEYPDAADAILTINPNSIPRGLVERPPHTGRARAGSDGHRRHLSSVFDPQTVGSGVDTVGEVMKSPVIKRSIVIAGHKTSVSLEDAFWKGLKEIASSRNLTLSQIASTVDSNRAHGNLSSALRLFVLDYYRAYLGEAATQNNQPALQPTSKIA